VAEQWKAQADKLMRRPSFLHLSPDQLIKLAEDTTQLTVAQLEALDEAWFVMFGELLILPTEPGVPRPPDQPSEPKPADHDVLGSEDGRATGPRARVGALADE
jgi:hypothetical protein